MNLRAVDTAVVVGPVSGHLYAGYDTGDRWNGAPLVAFTEPQLHALIEHGDGLDANGYGLTHDPQTGFQDTDHHAPPEPVHPQLIDDPDGQSVFVYVPVGRIWQIHDGTTTAPSLYNTDNECTACGSHLANPHQIECPTTEARTDHDLTFDPAQSIWIANQRLAEPPGPGLA